MPSYLKILRCAQDDKKGARNERGYSHLELMLVVGILIILVLFLLRMLSQFAVSNERLDMNAVVTDLEKSIQARFMEAKVKNREGDLPGLAESNPIALLSVPPDNYAGPQSGKEPLPDAGQWYFNYDSRELVYRVKHQDYFVVLGRPETGEFKEARYKLMLNYTDKDTNGRYDVGVDKLLGLALQPAANYAWLD